MPVSTAQNIRDKIWDEVGPKIIRTLEAAWAPVHPQAVAEEIFDQIWPDILKEIITQSNGMFEEGTMMPAVRAKMQSLRDNEIIE
ncbi:hypothetical protein H0W80_01730 [Candidatus Saccharibacteria bacterium]|nr:hypothetical protein [Candidatus Saccharibacteria bacterium]